MKSTKKTQATDYQSFLNRKALIDMPTGFEPKESEICSSLFDFQKCVVGWACRRGRAALFEDCGLGKTAQQLNWAHQVFTETNGNALILAPLAVAEQTAREGVKFGFDHVKVCKDQSEVESGITITNYEKLHRFDPSKFSAVVLDESSILKSFDGKFRSQIIESFARTPYKLACTATPAPNDYMELGNHAEFLGVMSRAEMLATFFVHDGGDTSKWRLKGHAEADFWKWLCSWAVNIRKPSDIGFDDGNFKLPELRINHHVVKSDFQQSGFLIPMQVTSLDERRAARRGSISQRIEKTAELANADSDQWLIWCDLNDESKALSKAIKDAVEVTGSDSEEHKAQSMLEFSAGKIRALVTKPDICGFGMNWQNAHKMGFCGLSDSYERFYQSVRREYRFGQKNEVQVHIVTSDQEGAVVANIKRKQADADRMADEMIKHMAEISSKEIRGTVRSSTPYNPQKQITIPSWLIAA